MFLAYANELPYELQKLFEVNNAKYPMRNPQYFKKKKVKTTCKFKCMYNYFKNITFHTKM